MEKNGPDHVTCDQVCITVKNRVNWFLYIQIGTTEKNGSYHAIYDQVDIIVKNGSSPNASQNSNRDTGRSLKTVAIW